MQTKLFFEVRYMRNLQAEMARFRVSKSDIKLILNCSDKTVDNKINGVTDFTVPEALKIRDTFFEGFRIDYLFAPDTHQLFSHETA